MSPLQLKNAFSCLAQLGCALVLLVWTVAPVNAGKAEYVNLAKRGWGYQLRTNMLGRDLSIPVRIHARSFAGAALCIVGDRPQAQTLEVINAFRALWADAFLKPMPMRYAGRAGRDCGSGRVVTLRLYSGAPPNRDLSDDLAWMNEIYGLGLPNGRFYAATSPAMGQTFFGRRGQGTHIMVSQPDRPVSGIEAQFFRSILIEELFQAFTFGMDVLLFTRDGSFLSKLQEYPVNPRRLIWTSEPFMRAILRSNPPALCEFDVFMLHAVAQAQVDQTNDPDFISYVERDFDRLLGQTRRALADDRFAPILDPDCAPLRD